MRLEKGIVADRIIPARAGFTRHPGNRGRKCGDHPRSRGVYSRRRPSCACCAGSSPLARGLPPEPRRRAGCRRIIPARAGFTRTAPGVRTCTRDHPRSRGVYSPALSKRRGGRGSSPLARGLLGQYSAGCGAGGIIPARAGFTWRFVKIEEVWRDHPRSRGVYSARSAAFAASNGSSPLARGLLPRKRAQELGNRIIPARAGFTGMLA